MNVPSFLNGSTPHSPLTIIIPTHETVENLLLTLNRLNCPDADRSKLMETLIQSIQIEAIALTKLGHMSQYISGYVGLGDTENQRQIAQEVTNLGVVVYTHLKSLNAYEDGYLYYQISEWRGSDAVLKRLSIPRIH